MDVRNRSVPVDAVLPHVFYPDIAAAASYLEATLGFSEHYRYGPPDAPQGAQLRFGQAVVMLTESTRGGRSTPGQSGAATQMLTIFVPDVDDHHRRATASGAVIIEELNETGYGERQYVAVDPWGHQWVISQHIRDVDPAEWGATVNDE